MPAEDSTTSLLMAALEAYERANPDDPAVIEFQQVVHELGQVAGTLSLIVAEDQHDGWVTRWACDPPPVGARFRATSCVWSDDWSVRTVLGWEPV